MMLSFKDLSLLCDYGFFGFQMWNDVFLAQAGDEI
jgi:hypothetical protein